MISIGIKGSDETSSVVGEVSRLRTQSTISRELPVQDTFYNMFRNSGMDMWILIDFKTKIPAFIVY